MSDDVIRIKTRVKYQGAWMPWRELANDYSIVNALEKKAPGGFGLGSAYTDYIADFNACIKNGWYRAYSNSLNSPSIGGWNARYGALLVSTRDSVIYHVYYVDRYSVMYTLERYSNDGGTTWSEWEYVNPPLQIGVEYRTTERYQEKPVYCKLVDCGSAPSNSLKKIDTGLDYTVIDRRLTPTGNMYANSNDNFSIPCESTNVAGENLNITHGTYRDSENVRQDAIFIYTTSTTLTGYTIYAVLKYTKITD